MPPLPAPHAPAASTTARVTALVYMLLVFYASCYPFSGWQDIGLPPLAYLWAPLPHYRTLFDLSTNVLAYIPLGVLVVMALYPAIQGAAASFLAIAAGTLLSGTVEAVQTFLPSRVPSNLDLLANAAGTCIGAFAGPVVTRMVLERGRLLPLRRRWFTREASRGLAALALWPLAQIYPQAYLFGHGHVTPVLSAWLSKWLSQPIDLTVLGRAGAGLGAEQYSILETVITACGVSGALLTLSCLLRSKAPKALLIPSLLLAAMATKSLSTALLFTPELTLGHAFAWLTLGAKGGLLVGALILFGLMFTSAKMQRFFAALLLTVGVIIVNLAPVNPYFNASLQTWEQGKLLNFNGALQFLSMLWPFFTLWFLLHPVHRAQMRTSLKQT